MSTPFQVGFWSLPKGVKMYTCTKKRALEFIRLSQKSISGTNYIFPLSYKCLANANSKQPLQSDWDNSMNRDRGKPWIQILWQY